MELETALAAERKRFWRETSQTRALSKVREISGICELNQLPEPDCETIGSISRQGYRIDKLILRPEPGICLPALAFVPERPDGPACLYVHADGKHTDASPDGPIIRLVRQGHVVLAPDVRGVGETKPASKHSYASYLPPEWCDCTIAYLLGKSLLAMRAEDILVCARFLASYQADDKAAPVRLLSVGRVGPAALHAAALERDLFAKVILRNGLISWSNVVHTPLSKNQYANLVHGALKTYDLPDLVATLPGGKVELIEPLDAEERPVQGD